VTVCSSSPNPHQQHMEEGRKGTFYLRYLLACAFQYRSQLYKACNAALCATRWRKRVRSGGRPRSDLRAPGPGWDAVRRAAKLSLALQQLNTTTTIQHAQVECTPCRRAGASCKRTPINFAAAACADCCQIAKHQRSLAGYSQHELPVCTNSPSGTCHYGNQKLATSPDTCHLLCGILC
jgi:hypothetical protein